MKKYFFLYIICFYGLSNMSAQQEYLGVITEKTCDCIKTKKATEEDISLTELGLCIFQYARDYKTEILRDFDIDLTTMNESVGEQLGEILGTEMLFKCPDVMMSLVEEFGTDEVSMVSTSGTISQIIEGR